MDDSRVSIDEFLKIAKVSERTIRKRANEIPGLRYEDGSYDIIKGTRYLGKYKKYVMNTSDEKRYVLLKLISEYKYVDHLILGVYKEQFIEFLKELRSSDYIVENGLYNHYGANAYDCTPKGEEVLRKQKKQAMKEITETIASSLGHFTGAVISELID